MLAEDRVRPIHSRSRTPPRTSQAEPPMDELTQEEHLQCMAAAKKAASRPSGKSIIRELDRRAKKAEPDEPDEECPSKPEKDGERTRTIRQMYYPVSVMSSKGKEKAITDQDPDDPEKGMRWFCEICGEIEKEAEHFNSHLKQLYHIFHETCHKTQVRLEENGEMKQCKICWMKYLTSKEQEHLASRHHQRRLEKEDPPPAIYTHKAKKNGNDQLLAVLEVRQQNLLEAPRRECQSHERGAGEPGGAAHERPAAR